MDNFLTQVQEMMSRCVVVDDTIIRNYSGLVFEGAQGLLLDTDYLVFAPHLTSSKTGSYNPKKILLENDLQNEDIEFCYVTRSYFTRHGFGPFPTECDKKSCLEWMSKKSTTMRMSSRGSSVLDILIPAVSVVHSMLIWHICWIAFLIRTVSSQ